MLSKNFSLAQGVKSDEHPAIPNVPSATQIINMRLTAEAILEPVFARFGPVTVNSFFRCPELNAAVGSKNPHSQHTEGCAVDFEVADVDNPELARWVRDHCTFDQVILENYRPTVKSSGWVHASFIAGGKCRGQCLTINPSGTYPNFVV